MQEEIINIVEIVGDGVCVASDDGEKVHNAICHTLDEGKKAVLSFKGVEDLTTVFLNAAIGQLYGKFKEEKLRTLLAVTNASEQDLDTLKHTVDRAKEYFKEADRFISASDDILGEDDDSNT